MINKKINKFYRLLVSPSPLFGITSEFSNLSPFLISIIYGLNDLFHLSEWFYLSGFCCSNGSYAKLITTILHIRTRLPSKKGAAIAVTSSSIGS